MTFVLCFLSSISWAAQTVSPSLMYPEETATVSYMDADNRLMRAQSSYTVKKTIQKGVVIYELFSQGAGQYDRHKDIVFTREAKMMEQENQLQVLYSKTLIKSKIGKLIAEYIKTYNYSDNKMVFRHLNKNGKILHREVFDIEGPICDDITMTHFLKTYVYQDDKAHRDFYLATNEPKVYHVRILPKKDEHLHLPVGNFQAKKFQLMADLGPMTEWVAKVVPKTYIWFHSEYPHDWLQYEGLEKGYKSQKILAHPLERSPAITALPK